MAADKESTAALLDPSALTEDMGTGERLAAGFGQGLSNVARNVGNIVGLVEDEEVEAAKRRDEALLDTGAGSVGSFAGETAALVPLRCRGAG
jgi:hypothetical protein